MSSGIGKWLPFAYDLADEYEAHNNQNRGYRCHNKVDNSRRKWNTVNKESKIRALRNVPAYSKLPIEQQNCPNKQKEHTSNSYALPYRKRLQNLQIKYMPERLQMQREKSLLL